MSDMRELGERYLSNTCCRNFTLKIMKTSNESEDVSMAEIEDLELRV
jgi:hypothetical protein